MRINLAKSAGFCFGVKRAITIARKLLQSGERVEMLGDIVHNEDVAAQLRKAGLKKVKILRKGKNKIFLIRAHGTGMRIIKKARLLGYKLIDATCPMVKEIHRITRDMEQKGYQIIIIGDKLHDEVRGIAGQLKNKAITISSLKGLPAINFSKINKACVVVQSTQNLEYVLKILSYLKARIKKLRFFNTICVPTRLRQEEIRRMPKKNDIMIIIGSKTSANTKRLYEISKSLNRRSFWIQSKDDLKPVWFKNVKNAGIASGASTPDTTTQKAIKRIKQILTG